jgi:hypothetical protein
MSFFRLFSMAATDVPTPPAGKYSFFFDSSNSDEPSYKDPAGVVTSLVGVAGPGVPVGGTTGQVLAKIDATNYNTQWVAPGMANPMTTAGDVIYGGVAGLPTRLGIGANGTFLGVVAGALVYTSPAGTGDVVGPASAVNNNIAVYDTTTGKLIKDGGATIASLAPLASPTLTGTPAAPTAAAGTSTTQLATTAFVNTLNVQSIASSSTPTPTSVNDQLEITALATNMTLTNPTGTMQNAWGLSVRIKDNATPRTIAYGTQYRAVGVTLPTTTVASKTLYLGMVWNGADTTFDVVSVALQA